MNKLDEAILFATKAHEGQVRKLSHAPYIIHPLETMIIVSEFTLAEDVLCAAVLHDVIEDTSVTIEEVEERFGKRVAELVYAETENKRKGIPPSETWRIRKEETIAHLKETEDLAVKMLWLGDKLSNMRSVLLEYLNKGDAIWQSFNQTDKKEHEWYYVEIYKALKKDFGKTKAFMEYETILSVVFKLRPEKDWEDKTV